MLVVQSLSIFANLSPDCKPVVVAPPLPLTSTSHHRLELQPVLSSPGAGAKSGGGVGAGVFKYTDLLGEPQFSRDSDTMRMLASTVVSLTLY